MRSYGAAVLRSTDQGDTWTDLQGGAVGTPTTYSHRVAVPPLDLWTLTINPKTTDDEIWLNKWVGQTWETTQLESYLPTGRLAVEGMMTIDTRDRIHLVITALDGEQATDGKFWGHPSSEVFYLQSADGGATFSCDQLSPTNPEQPNWLPSISRPRPYHPVENPTILYTTGGPGEGLRPDLKTQVWCVRTN
jgi:hypothetical protein